ncbi:MAG: NYN domain-containing protein [Candidatus Asgardarchaeum californiense]|nr:MAG: NYN domain-containing protein [Candidatus Asgardarchaeum californiense]
MVFALSKFTTIFTKRKKVALLVDGPNMLRKDFNIKLEDLLTIASKYGKVQVAKVYLNQYAPAKLAEAVSNSGFTPEIVAHDIHVAMAIDSVVLMKKINIEVLVVASRHARCVPILRKARESGIETVVIGFNPGFSVALRNTADYSEEIRVTANNHENKTR